MTMMAKQKCVIMDNGVESKYVAISNAQLHFLVASREDFQSYFGLQLLDLQQSTRMDWQLH